MSWVAAYSEYMEDVAEERRLREMIRGAGFGGPSAVAPGAEMTQLLGANIPGNGHYNALAPLGKTPSERYFEYSPIPPGRSFIGWLFDL